jgi:hypothetical protein
LDEKVNKGGGKKPEEETQTKWYGWSEVFHSRVLDELFSLKKG